MAVAVDGDNVAGDDLIRRDLFCDAAATEAVDSDDAAGERLR